MMRFNYQQGFTLIEIMIVIAFVAIVGAVGLLYGIDSYQRATFHSDKDILIAALQRARAQAVGNICFGTCTDGKPHGVYISEDAQGNVLYTIFQGTSYAVADHIYNDVISANPNTKRSGISEIVFGQLSGSASPSGDIVLTDSSGRISAITVGSEGEITWTN